MARKGSGGSWGWWLLGGLAITGVVALAAAPSEEEKRRRHRGRAARQVADRNLLARLEDLAADPRIDVVKRRVAKTGADLFRLYWINAGRSGDVIPASIKIQLYGNWCGPGYGGGPCVDEIDCLCREHDREYDQAARLEAGHA